MPKRLRDAKKPGKKSASRVLSLRGVAAMALTICPGCGAQVSTGAANCPSCGKPFDVGTAFSIAILQTIMPVAFLHVAAYVSIPAAVAVVVLFLRLPIIIKYGK
jgi:uncharacterized membrane protein YvbJ